jgi:hypothetical protein
MIFFFFFKKKKRNLAVIYNYFTGKLFVKWRITGKFGEVRGKDRRSDIW